MVGLVLHRRIGGALCQGAGRARVPDTLRAGLDMARTEPKAILGTLTRRLRFVCPAVRPLGGTHPYRLCSGSPGGGGRCVGVQYVPPDPGPILSGRQSCELALVLPHHPAGGLAAVDVVPALGGALGMAASERRPLHAFPLELDRAGLPFLLHRHRQAQCVSASPISGLCDIFCRGRVGVHGAWKPGLEEASRLDLFPVSHWYRPRAGSCLFYSIPGHDPEGNVPV
ncbi:MAG: hypothetical protein BWY09_02466 [Candidatus Hydrogenedentes bacterium ADurb.Bin179]|nr:MAG: hypothetical protein BWY09_02466 [Candidatus Hydrogenedentes bacterium ADurb.Bin179]